LTCGRVETWKDIALERMSAWLVSTTRSVYPTSAEGLTQDTMEDDTKAAATGCRPKKHSASMSSKFSPRRVTAVPPVGDPIDGVSRRRSGGGRNAKRTVLAPGSISLSDTCSCTSPAACVGLMQSTFEDETTSAGAQTSPKPQLAPSTKPDPRTVTPVPPTVDEIVGLAARTAGACAATNAAPEAVKSAPLLDTSRAASPARRRGAEHAISEDVTMVAGTCTPAKRHAAAPPPSRGAFLTRRVRLVRGEGRDVSA